MKEKEKEQVLNEVRLLIRKSITEEYNRKVVNSILLEEDNDENIFFKILTESANEAGINIDELLIKENNILSENKKLLTESLTVMIIGGALASGKFLDLVGGLFRKVRNWLIKKGALKGKTWDKSYLEKAGEWLHEWIIMGFFRVAATAILGVIGGFTAMVGIFINPKIGDLIGKIITKENIDSLATTLFYCCVTIFGALGLSGIVHSVSLGHAIFTPIYEAVTTGTKIYELLWLTLAFFMATFIKDFEPYKGNVKAFAHAITNCSEDHGNGWKTMKTVLSKFKKHDFKVADCIKKTMASHGKEGEHGKDQLHNQPSADNQQQGKTQPVVNQQQTQKKGFFSFLKKQPAATNQQQTQVKQA